MGGKARRDLRALPLRPGAVTPGKRQAGSLASGRRRQLPACPAQAGMLRGGGEQVVAERVCAFQSVCSQAGRIVRIRSACGSVRGACKLAAGAPGWERHPARIRCRARAPPRAARSAPLAPAPRLVPPRAEESPSAGDSWILPPSFPPATPKRGSSPIKKKEPTTFFQAETKPKRVPDRLPSTSGSTRQLLRL